ncbi:hypothetical protein [Paenibacillus daejeonensis]|uniref:hypothetical protein n=1 Tax=Paenibacillus daejeonensis TaxID=135193 RepID=UPI00036F4FAA|nr:hypothetical protein [Paenibacillus daejeonensis]
MSQSQTSKVIKDMTLWQLTWSLYLLGGVIIFFFGLRYFASEATFLNLRDDSFMNRSFLDFTVQPGSIFMLVLGLMSVSGFLTFYVKQGITRRSYFTGAAVSSLIVAGVVTAAGAIIHVIINALMPNMEWLPVMGYEGSELAVLPLMVLQMYLFYLLGWIINGMFYRYGVLAGMVSIAGSVMLLIGVSFAISPSVDMPLVVTERFDWPALSSGMSLAVSLPLLALVCVILLAVMRLMTKRVRVKLK